MHQRDAFALHVADLGSIPGIPPGALSQPGVIPELCQVCAPTSPLKKAKTKHTRNTLSHLLLVSLW